MLQAVALCQGVTNPESSGIGGGGFIMVRTPNGTYEVIDAREQAPAAATQDMYMCATACLPVHMHSKTTMCTVNLADCLCMQAVCSSAWCCMPLPSCRVCDAPLWLTTAYVITDLHWPPCVFVVINFVTNNVSAQPVMVMVMMILQACSAETSQMPQQWVAWLLQSAWS